MTPREQLALDQFRIEQTLTLFDRPIGCLVYGAWCADGACHVMVGMMALEPFDHCRLIAGARFAPEEGLSFVRSVEKDDPRDDTGVIERHFEQPLDQILAAIFGQLHDAFTAAAGLREGRAGEMPVREMPAPAWVH